MGGCLENIGDISSLGVWCTVSLRQNGVGTGFTTGDAILTKGHNVWAFQYYLPAAEV